MKISTVPLFFMVPSSSTHICCDSLLVNTIKSTIQEEPNIFGMTSFLDASVGPAATGCDILLHNGELSFVSHATAANIQDLVMSLDTPHQRASMARGVFKYLLVVLKRSNHPEKRNVSDCRNLSGGSLLPDNEQNFIESIMNWTKLVSSCT
jgi:hypothetical protein